MTYMVVPSEIGGWCVVHRTTPDQMTRYWFNSWWDAYAKAKELSEAKQ